MTDHPSLYAETSPARLFFRMALPGAVSMIASSLWGLFDGIFVGRFLGEAAFAALNLAFPFVLIQFSLADLIGVGAAVHISVSLGKQEQEEANRFFTGACLLIVIVSILSGAALFWGAPLLMRLMGADEALAALAVSYIRVYAALSPLTSMVFAVDNFLRICGKIKGSMALNILMSVCILGLEYLFLAVFGMGIAGSPLAVSCGMFLCTLVALYPFARKKLTLRFCRPRLSAGLIGRIAAGGSPTFLSTVASRLTSILMNAVLLKMGGSVAVSAYGILMYVGETLVQLLYGTCDGMQPVIGYHWGARRMDSVKGLLRCTMTACAVISLGGGALMAAFPEALAALFAQSGEQALLRMAADALRLYSLTFLTRWFGFAVQSFLAALEKPLPAAALSLANALVLPVILLPVLWPLGLNGLWLNTPITSALVSALSLVSFFRLRGALAGRTPHRPA